MIRPATALSRRILELLWLPPFRLHPPLFWPVRAPLCRNLARVGRLRLRLLGVTMTRANTLPLAASRRRSPCLRRAGSSRSIWLPTVLHPTSVPPGRSSRSGTIRWPQLRPLKETGRKPMPRPAGTHPVLPGTRWGLHSGLRVLLSPRRRQHLRTHLRRLMARRPFQRRMAAAAAKVPITLPARWVRQFRGACGSTPRPWSKRNCQRPTSPPSLPGLPAEWRLGLRQHPLQCRYASGRPMVGSSLMLPPPRRNGSIRARG